MFYSLQGKRQNCQNDLAPSSEFSSMWMAELNCGMEQRLLAPLLCVLTQILVAKGQGRQAQSVPSQETFIIWVIQIGWRQFTKDFQKEGTLLFFIF